MNSLVYLVQTDTTVGFLSKNDKKLSEIKNRNSKQKILQVVDSFKTLKNFNRVPKQHRKYVRNKKLSSFIYPSKLSFRVVDHNSVHHSFVKKFGYIYSTSANRTKENFNKEFAIEKSDIILYTKNEFEEKTSSFIYKMNKNKIKRIR